MFNRTLLTFGLGLLIALPAHAFDFNFEQAISIAKKVQQARKPISQPEEIEIGHGIAENLLGAAPLLPDIRVQRYVNEVGRWLSLQTERPDLPWQFGVLDSSDINAFATPGGTIFITNGLLQRMDSESELAGVLAHEMVHVLRKHHLAALQKAARIDIASEIAGEALKNNGNSAVLDKAIKAGTEVYARGLDKEDEFEADRMGIVIATRAGYDPYGLPAVLQILDAINQHDSSLALMFKTHPSPHDRLNLLDKEMGDRFDDYPAPLQADKRFYSEMTAQRK
ncbi:MAG: M48 family metalloprotease [Gallionella sp.]